MKKIALFIFAVLLFYNSDFARIYGVLQVFIEGPVQFVIEDSRGRKEGNDLIRGMSYDEIPNAGYGYSGVSSIEPGVPDIEAWDFSFEEALVDTIFKEKYTLTVFARKPCLYKGGISMNQTDKTGYSFEFIGVLDSLGSVEYEFYFSTDTTEKPYLRKKLNSRVFCRDIELCYRLGLIKTDEVYNSLWEPFSVYERKRQQGDFKSAEQALMSFLTVVNNPGNTKITSAGKQILREDAETLRKEISLYPPDVAGFPGALILITDSLQLHISGKEGKIDGRGHTDEGKLRESDMASSGIYCSSAGLKKVLLDGIGSLLPDTIMGISLQGCTLEVHSIRSRKDVHWKIEDRLFGKPFSQEIEYIRLTETAGGTLGSPDFPVVAYAPEGVELTKDFRGYGILVVNKGLKLEENAIWNGLVVVRNSDNTAPYCFLSYRAKIIGSLVIFSDSPIGEANVRFSEQSAVLYSNNLMTLLGKLPPLDRIFE